MITDEQLLILSHLSYYSPKKKLLKNTDKFYKKDGIYYGNNATILNTNIKLFFGIDYNYFNYDIGIKNEHSNKLKENLYKVRQFEIIAYISNSSSGYSAYAFCSPQCELVFAIRGTQMYDIADLTTDFEIMVNKEDYKIAQFKDDKTFINNVINKLSYQNKIYFTGHSLGGALAQYASYINNYKTIRCITFNGVGTFNNVVKIAKNDKQYNDIIDYSFSNDIIGKYGIDLGVSKYIYSNSYNVFTNHPIYKFYDYFLDGYIDNKYIIKNYIVSKQNSNNKNIKYECTVNIIEQALKFY